MAGKFISLILAASVAVTGMTGAPAQAGNNDLARALAALAGVVVIGAVIHDANKDKRRAAPQRHARPNYAAHSPYKAQKRHKRQQAIADRAYRQGYIDHQRVVRDRRTTRRAHRRGHNAQYGYSARPQRYGY